ncbi:MAG: hypothetical protein NVSMB23_03220 [Myxococcales bacterium]
MTSGPAGIPCFAGPGAAPSIACPRGVADSSDDPYWGALRVDDTAVYDAHNGALIQRPK